MNEQFKHTKGKWRKNGNQISANNCDSICTVSIQRPSLLASIEDVEANANGRLIEKSPELLEAVINLQKRLELLIHMTPSGIERNAMCDENIVALGLIDEIKG